jgi:hypothetical protein
MRSFPLPVRVAAGLVATTVEQTRHLPRYLLGLPITVTSQALQISMRIQQQITELAIKGDETLSGLRDPVEQPRWATFDEDQAEAPARRRPAATQPAGSAGPVAEPAVAPGYDELTLAQLRGRLRKFSESDLAELLNYERAHRQRPEFLRMLTNRIDTVREARG